MLMMLLSISTVFFANENDFRIIKQATDGRFYLEEQDIIDIANYIKQLEELNKNYLAQIENLKQQIANLEAQISNFEQQIAILNEEKKQIENQLVLEKAKTWVIVGAITLGAVVYLFVK